MAVDGRFVDDEDGVETGVVWIVYAERDEDLPNRDVVAAANMLLVLHLLYQALFTT